MILGVGLDLVEIERLERALERHGRRFEERVFTRREREDCGGQADRLQRLAARFAAKEACLKAFGTGWSQGLAFGQVEVVNEPGGRPALRLSGAAERFATSLGVRRTHLSLTHQSGHAAAVVILES